jgi:hypothetical protein
MQTSTRLNVTYCRWDLVQWLERLTSNAKVATVLGFIISIGWIWCWISKVYLCSISRDVHSCSFAETPQPPSSPRIWAHIRGLARALLVSQDRRHLFVAPLITSILRHSEIWGEPDEAILNREQILGLTGCINWIWHPLLFISNFSICRNQKSTRKKTPNRWLLLIKILFFCTVLRYFSS